MAITNRRRTKQRVKVFLEETETWKALHDEANVCKDLEELLASGNDLFEAISKWDAAWHSLVFREQLPYDKAAEDDILLHYRRLFEPSAFILGLISRFEQGGYHVVGADQYRKNREEAISLTVDDAEFFGDCLHSLEAQAIRENQRGETVDFEDGCGQ